MAQRGSLIKTLTENFKIGMWHNCKLGDEPIHNTIKKNKNLGLKLTNDVQDLYTTNYKTFVCPQFLPQDLKEY